MLKKVSIKKIEDNESPRFLKTQKITFQREGSPEDLTWEMVKSHSSVHIGVFNSDTKEFLFVKQVRIPVLANNPGSDGEVVECVAGLVDKDCSMAQIAKEEILEEIGYDVPLEEITFLRKLYSSVGSKGNVVFCYTAVVTESMKVNEGGGLDDEDIEVVRIPLDDIYDFTQASGKYENVCTDATTLYLVATQLTGI